MRAPLPSPAALLWGLGLTLSPLSSPAYAQTTLRLEEVIGRAEVLSGEVWRPVSGSAALGSGLRTGAGRAQVRSQVSGSGGSILLGSNSAMRTYNREAQLQQGQFYLEGPLALYVQGYHAVLDSTARVRVDLMTGQVPRIAVLNGGVRVALDEQVRQLRARQQLNIQTHHISAFQETDPWYAARFLSAGEARVEALRGQVQHFSGTWQKAAVGRVLEAGHRLSTAANSWAEVGFTGGGYLRLQENSELTVIGVEQTSRGRSVALQLTRGSAWNVVEKGQGGYRITTPVISTAVRGTTFRVDATGTVKVFDGSVAVPEVPGQVVAGGEQLTPAGVGPVVLDAMDAFNQALDEDRARELTIRAEPLRPMQQLELSVLSLPASRVTATVAGQSWALTEEPLPTGGQGVTEPQWSRYVLRPASGPAQPRLPEGRHTLVLQAERYHQKVTLELPLIIDQTPPTVSGWKVTQQGRVLRVSGAVNDAGPVSLLLSYTGEAGEALNYTYTFWASGPFDLTLPAAQAPDTIAARLIDQAGNQGHAP
ncbi:FecR domain-containing protein [Deinococcus lacus]|uniref:FecR domain-containing protein n=1 Tax=Deinococcus lacus TaxID=392561 RepID=A0ABW1Y9W3_9DEIO